MTNSLRLNPPVFIDATSAVSLEIPKKNIVNVVICSAGTALLGSHGAVRVDGPPQPNRAALRCAALAAADSGPPREAAERRCVQTLNSAWQPSAGSVGRPTL
jgi:hypothetical protein